MTDSEIRAELAAAEAELQERTAKEIDRLVAEGAIPKDRADSWLARCLADKSGKMLADLEECGRVGQMKF